MEELIHKLGIDWKLLIAQVINFLVLLLVLYKFAYGPILKVLKDRQDKIAKSLSDAKAIEEKLAATNAISEEKILAAKKEAQVILEKTAQAAQQIKQEKLLETKKEMEKLKEKGQAELNSEKEKIVREAKEEITDLVLAVSAKIMAKELDEKTNQKLIEETIKEIS